jgi:hypothetical protein
LTQGEGQALAAGLGITGDTKQRSTHVCTRPEGRVAPQAGRRRLEGGRDSNSPAGGKHHLAKSPKAPKTTVSAAGGVRVRVTGEGETTSAKG